MNGPRNSSDTDLDKLSGLKALSWLSPVEMASLVSALALASFERHEVIWREAALASEAHILLTGIARITCMNARSERVTVAMLAPGPVPEYPTAPTSRFDFRCEAYNDCRVGSLSWNDLSNITRHNAESVFQKFHQNNLQHWYRVLLRNSNILSLDLHQRIGLTLLELSADFGIKESRGMLLRVSFSHQDIADLVGASRPRVTEHLAQFEREQVIIRQGRQLIICPANIVQPPN